MVVGTTAVERGFMSFASKGDQNVQKISNTQPSPKNMVKDPRQNKGPLLIKTLVFGILSASLYYLLFSNEQWVTTEYTKGGWHTIYPVCTALIFSFVHGAFASNLLSLLGIEPKSSH